MEAQDSASQASPDQDRRTFLTWLSSLVMAGSLVAAYGSLAGFISRFLYPAKPDREGWLFVREVSRLAPGDSLAYELPNGSPVHITRQGGSGLAADFKALSSVCPHLGCQVHWESHNERFFCPCHNGVFTPAGKAVAGPPAEAGQSLLQYPLKVEKGLLFILAPLEQLARGGSVSPRGAGRPGGCGEARRARG